jgi:hypothetical protein
VLDSRCVHVAKSRFLVSEHLGALVGLDWTREAQVRMRR